MKDIAESRYHEKSFSHERYKNETTLSNFVWESKVDPTNIEWKLLKKCKTYAPGRKTCDLCLTEKVNVILSLRNTMCLNRRTDLGNKCPHMRGASLQDINLRIT